MSGIIYDLKGNPIVSETVKREALEQLQDYIHKNQKKVQDWFTAYGTVRPPLRYDLSAKTWVWMGE